MRQINKNLTHLYRSLQTHRGAILEGSSRSGKTWSSIDFIIYLCSRVETNCTINIIKETYQSFKTTLYDDFNRRLPDFGIPSPFEDKQEVSSFRIFGNKINLLGADKPSKFHGATCDYFYINEGLEVSKAIFDQSEMRCRKFWWIDYNPNRENHYIFSSVIPRSDVSFLKTTFLDNPHISDPEKNKILSYEPWDPEDRGLPEDQRRPHPVNVIQGTADKFMWHVYGLGLRTVAEEIIFKTWSTFDEPPQSWDVRLYGLDFGYSVDPSAAVEVLIDGKNLYITELLYETGLTNPAIYDRLKDKISNDTYIIADSAEPKSIDELRALGLTNIIEAVKGPDSIIHGIGKLKSYKLFLQKNSVNLLNEFSNYRFSKSKDGEILNKPVDRDNHLLDACRYAVTRFNY